MPKKTNSFKEIRDILKDLAERQQKTDEELKKTNEALKKTNEALEKTNEALEKTDEALKKTDEELKKTNEALKKTEELVKNTNKQVGDLTNGWGKFVEGLVAPSVIKLFKQQGINVREIYLDAQAHKGPETLEIDVLAVGTNKQGEGTIIAICVKSNLSKSEFVDDFLQDLNRFFEFFPRYRGMNLIGACAGIRIGNGIDKYALKKGLYVLVPSGEIMQIETPPNLRIWRE